MFSRIEALRYRCLRNVQRDLDAFHVLVGPNASGKSTFLDVVAFLSDLVARPLEDTVSLRSANFHDLLWAHEGRSFELAIEAKIPSERRELLADPRFDTVRYEVSVGLDDASDELVIASEKGTLLVRDARHPQSRLAFPAPPDPPATILTGKAGKQAKTLFRKVAGGNDNFYPEAPEAASKKGWVPAFKLGPRKSTLANLPDDESQFPVSTWLKHLLASGVQSIQLNGQILRRASPPGQPRGFRTDGSNLPWVVDAFRRKSNGRFEDWIKHLRTALPDLESVRSVERPDDRHLYLMLTYRGGLDVPSWMTSDGTLRLLALTLPAYLEDFKGVYLIEEPENGVHPRAVHALFESLSSAYDAQILLATHSPVILSAASPASVLCFAKDSNGATDIVAGTEHPALADWKGEESLGVLFASGVLS